MTLTKTDEATAGAAAAASAAASAVVVWKNYTPEQFFAYCPSVFAQSYLDWPGVAPTRPMSTPRAALSLTTPTLTGSAPAAPPSHATGLLHWVKSSSSVGLFLPSPPLLYNLDSDPGER